MLITGIFEAGLFMQTNLGVANTVRAGARSASAAGADAYADLHIVHSIAEESSAIPRDVIEYIVVYRADDYGATPGEVVETVVFNGRVSAQDPVPGKEARPHLVSVQSGRAEFEELVLSKVDAVACLKRLDARFSSDPCEMEAVEPYDWELELDMALTALEAKESLRARGFPV